MNLEEATELYQVYQEAVRSHPESEELCEDLEKAKAMTEMLWLEKTWRGVIVAEHS